jgi:hypothetical protein
MPIRVPNRRARAMLPVKFRCANSVSSGAWSRPLYSNHILKQYNRLLDTFALTPIPFSRGERGWG